MANRENNQNNQNRENRENRENSENRENREDRENRRNRRVAAARRSARQSQVVDREQTRAILQAAGARNIDDEAVEAAAVLTEERLVELAARAVESSEDRNESRLSASSVAIAARREAERR